MEWLYSMSIGLGLVAACTAYIIYKKLFSPSLLDRLGYKQKERPSIIKDSFNLWVDHTEKILRRGSMRMKGWQFVLLVLTGSAASVAAGIFIFQNFVAAVFLTVATVLICEQYILFRERSVMNQMNSQLAAAVRIFAASFANTPQVEHGIAAVAESCPDPLGRVFRRADRMLHARVPLDGVLLEMARGMNFEYGLMFIQLIRQVKNNTLVAPLFHELVSRITTREMLIRENQVQVAGEKTLSLAMVIAPVPSYFFICAVVPEAQVFLTQTFFGRVIVTLIFFSAVLWAVMSRITERVDY